MFLILAWPSGAGKSLGARVVNWAVDPGDALPTMPPPLPMSLDDGDTVTAHDAIEREYYDAYQRSTTRLRHGPLRPQRSRFSDDSLSGRRPLCGTFGARHQEASRTPPGTGQAVRISPSAGAFGHRFTMTPSVCGRLKANE